MSLIYPIILDNTKSNALITLSKYPIKYSELVFLSFNFAANMLSILNPKYLLDFLQYNFLN